MTAIDFPECTHVLAKDQPQYHMLPIHREKNDLSGTVTSCWRLTFWERVKVLFTGRVWLLQLTFGEQFQPICPTTKYPFVRGIEEIER